MAWPYEIINRRQVWNCRRVAAQAILNEEGSYPIKSERFVPLTNSWRAVGSSADGGSLVGAVFGVNGDIFASHSIVPPRLNLAVSGNQLMLSWTIPSSTFALQEASATEDTTSWSDVTNNVTVDYSTLRDSVTVTLDGPGRFFRLVSR